MELSEEPDDFYEFTAEDYYRLMATKKEGMIYPCNYRYWFICLFITTIFERSNLFSREMTEVELFFCHFCSNKISYLDMNCMFLETDQNI